ncbi:MAG: polymer-forming cytoskeletal protein [Bdellovibrionota bacterium]
MALTEKKQGQKRRGASGKESSVTIVTPGCHFNGKLFCRGSSRIGGRIEGEIVSEGMLIIEEEAIVTAEIRAEEAVIQGSVEGKVYATGRVELTSTCRFEGDIISPCLIINEGAQFNGRSTMIDPAVVKTSGAPKVEQLHKNGEQGQGQSVTKEPEVGVRSYDARKN